MVEGVTRAKASQTCGLKVGLAGIEEPRKPRADASAARSFATRRGLGRQRHIDTRYLWLQEEGAHGRVRVGNVKGDSNPAEIMTKFLPAADIVHMASRLSVVVRV